MLRSSLLPLSLLAVASCSQAAPTGGPIDVDASFAPEPVDGSTCGAVALEHAVEGRAHVPVCSPVTYASNPPSSGDHYPIWAAYRTYDTPVPRGFTVHDLEHGAVVVSYHCPNGCAEDLAAARAFVEALPPDPACPDPGLPHGRVVLTPDPLLDVEWAASAWLWTLRARCFERSTFAAFVAEHAGRAPEQECADGEDPTLGGGLCADSGL